MGEDEVTDRAVRAAVERVLARADPALADAVEAECARPSWQGIIRRVWPNTKYIDVIVTGAMAQYIPTLEFYGGGLPLTCHGVLRVPPHHGVLRVPPRRRQ